MKATSITNNTARQHSQRKLSASRGKSTKLIRYYTSFTNTIADVLASRGWKEVGEESEWDFVWADR